MTEAIRGGQRRGQRGYPDLPTRGGTCTKVMKIHLEKVAVAFKEIRWIRPQEIPYPRQYRSVLGFSEPIQFPIVNVGIPQEPLAVGDLNQSGDKICAPLVGGSPRGKRQSGRFDEERAHPAFEKVPPAKLVVRPGEKGERRSVVIEGLNHR